RRIRKVHEVIDYVGQDRTTILRARLSAVGFAGVGELDQFVHLVRGEVSGRIRGRRRAHGSPTNNGCRAIVLPLYRNSTQYSPGRANEQEAMRKTAPSTLSGSGPNVNV